MQPGQRGGERAGTQEGCWPVPAPGCVTERAGSPWRAARTPALTGLCCALSAALLQKYLDNYDLSIKVIYVLGTLGFSIGTAVMAMFANVYIAMVMISTMGVVSMSISYCPYALLGQYHDIKEVRPPAGTTAGRVTSRSGSEAGLLLHSFLGRALSLTRGGRSGHKWSPQVFGSETAAEGASRAAFTGVSV